MILGTGDKAGKLIEITTLEELESLWKETENSKENEGNYRRSDGNYRYGEV